MNTHTFSIPITDDKLRGPSGSLFFYLCVYKPLCYTHYKDIKGGFLCVGIR